MKYFTSKKTCFLTSLHVTTTFSSCALAMLTVGEVAASAEISGLDINGLDNSRRILPATI